MNPQDVAKFTPQQFTEAVAYAWSARGGHVADAHVTACEETTLGLAILEWFDNDQFLSASFMYRYVAMTDLVNARQLGTFARMLPTGLLHIHDAVFAVAATAPMTASFQFEPASFLESVQQISAQFPDDSGQ
jgi:hypothetical protein